MVQHVTESTHVKGHTLDLVISRSDSDFVKHVTVDAYLSDHAAVMADIMLAKPGAPKKHVSYRKWRAIDLDAFQDDLSKVAHACDNLSDLVNNYNDKIRSVVDSHAPLMSKVISVKQDMPWSGADTGFQHRGGAPPK